jgi:hypothetical protein
MAFRSLASFYLNAQIPKPHDQPERDHNDSSNDCCEPKNDCKQKSAKDDEDINHRLSVWGV